MNRLNLGCADHVLEGWLNVDIAPPCDQFVDLERVWPWGDDTFDEVLARDVIEHIGDAPNGRITQDGSTTEWVSDGEQAMTASVSFPGGVSGHRLLSRPMYSTRGRVFFMNELHRVMKPGATVTIVTPDAAFGPGFYQDPTHCSPWTRNSFQYFGAGRGGEFAWNRLAKAYGITARFDMIGEPKNDVVPDVYDSVVKLTVVLRAVK